MSRGNVELVRERYERFARGDFSAMTEVPDDFEFVASSDVPDAGTYQGEAARQWMKAWVGSFDGLTMEATEIVDAGDHVLVALVQRGRPWGSGTEVEGRWWAVDMFRDGAAIRSQIFANRSEAVEAAGLRE
jgi:ketosteroid isomerase-like protein